MTTFNIYRRESYDDNPPVAIATGLTSMSYSDSAVEVGKSYLYSVGTVKGVFEKISDEVLVLVGERWEPDNYTNILFLADDISTNSTTTWVDRKTGVTLSAQSSRTIENINGNKFVNSVKSGISFNSSSSTISSISTNAKSLHYFCVFSSSGSDIGLLSRFSFSEGNDKASILNNATYSGVKGVSAGGRVKATTTSYYGLSSGFIPPVGDICILNAILDFENGVCKIYINGDQKITGTMPSGTTTAQAGNFSIGGYNVNTNTNFLGLIGCVAVVKNNTSVDLVNKLSGWAAHKYRLTDKLPTDHPYKTLIPTI